MDIEWVVPVCAGFFLIAMSYASVGQAGATGYLALMALAGVLPGEMRTTALVLNVVASAYTSLRFGVAGYLDWRALRRLVIASAPMAALGGTLSLEPAAYRTLTGALLAIAALALLWRIRSDSRHAIRAHKELRASYEFALGGGIGFLSGVTGIGGGILLGPALLALGRAAPRNAAALSAPFNLLNSALALWTGMASSHPLPANMLAYGGSVLAGAMVGSQLAVRSASERALTMLLTTLTLIGSAKLLSGG